MLTVVEKIVKGYYECAFNRFADITTSSILCESFEDCRHNLQKTMMEHFDVTNADGMRLVVIYCHTDCSSK